MAYENLIKKNKKYPRSKAHYAVRAYIQYLKDYVQLSVVVRRPCPNEFRLLKAIYKRLKHNRLFFNFFWEGYSINYTAAKCKHGHAYTLSQVRGITPLLIEFIQEKEREFFPKEEL